MDTQQDHVDVPPPGQRGIPTYGCIIKQKRLAKNLSQEELAAKAGCDARVVMKAEKDGPISLKKLHKIAKALEIPCGYIANLDGENKSFANNAYCEVTIKFKLPAGPFFEKEGLNDFTIALKAALAPFESLFAMDVREGSVLIDFEMTIATLNALCIAQEYRLLPEFAIEWIDVTAPKPKGPRPIVAVFPTSWSTSSKARPSEGPYLPRSDTHITALNLGVLVEHYAEKSGPSSASSRFEQAPARARSLAMLPTWMLENDTQDREAEK